MYYEAIIYCLQNDIHYIAEGARKSQLFSIEQPKVIESYKSLLKEFDIELLLPVYDLDSDWIRENELLFYHILPSASEDKCVLGMPLNDNVPENQTETIYHLLENNIKPRYIKELKLRPVRVQTISKEKGRIEFK